VTGKNVLVLASTFPFNEVDPKPDFVKRQVIALKKENPELNFFVLAPAEYGAGAKQDNGGVYQEIRFSYFYPRSFQVLTKYGIMPTIKKNKFSLFLVPFFLVMELWSAFKVARKYNIDYIYAHWFFPQALVAYFISILLSIPFFYTSHSSDVQIMSKIPWIGKILVRRVTRRSVGVTSVSGRSLRKISSFFSANEWERIGKKITIIPMGVTCSVERTFRSVDNGVILFMGRLVKKKGVDFLIEALLDKDICFKKLIVAGSGPEQESLMEKVANNYQIKDKVSFVGYVSGKEKESLFDQASLVVVPSIIADDGDAEGMPVVLMEAFSRGKICIATKESGADEYIMDGENGFLVDQRRPDQLAKKIDVAMKLPQKERRVISERALQLAKVFDWSSIARRQLVAMGLGSDESTYTKQ